MRNELSESINMEIGNLDANLQFCSFYIEEQLFGVNILSVKEIIEEFSFTKVYHTPNKVKGYMNVRGNIYLILDMRPILGYEVKSEIGESDRVILFKSSVGEDFGILIEKVEDIISVREVDLENMVNPNIKIENPIISATCKLNDKLMTIIEPLGILEDLEKSKIKFIQENSR